MPDQVEQDIKKLRAEVDALSSLLPFPTRALVKSLALRLLSILEQLSEGRK